VAHGVPSLVRAPVPYTPDLTTSAMREFVRSGRLGVVPVSANQRLVDEASMDVVASSSPLVSRAMTVVASNDVTMSPASGGCSSVQAAGANPQVELASPPLGGFVSIRGSANANVGVSAVQGKLTVPAAPITLNALGRAIENSEVPNGDIVLALPSGATTLLCTTP
jgi:hypothetical protein